MYTVMVEMIGMDHICMVRMRWMDHICIHGQLQGVMPLQECWKLLNWIFPHSEEPDMV